MIKINLQQLIADREAGTDGPWHVHPGNNDEYRICFTSMHNWLAEVFYDEDDPDPEADARRIARLPDLEAAYIEAVGLLKNFMSVVEHCTVEDGVCCCGDDMINHPEPMACGHSPVDNGTYAASRFYEAAKKMIGGEYA